MILLWGLAEDPPLAALRDILGARGTAYTFVDQRAPCPRYRFDFGPTLRGQLDDHDLAAVSSAYIRPVDYGVLAEHNIGADAPRRVASLRRFARHLTDWLELAPILVVNRFSAQASNTSKLYQLRLIAEHGFATPASLATTDAQAARDFHRVHTSVVYKSLSSVRSIVSQLDEARLDRLDELENCPTLFQQYIAGTDYRVHVVGDSVIATMLVSDEDDYRYDRAAERLAVQLPTEIGQRCVSLSQALGLAFSGIDLRRATDGRWHCFEVNPSPAFPYFEEPGTTRIAEALADLLTAAPTVTGTAIISR